MPLYSTMARDRKDRIFYGVNHIPPVHLTFLFGLQQALMCIGGTLSLPFILTPLLCAEGQDEVRAQLLSITMFMCGLATVLQCICGIRLPIIQGGSHTFVAPIVAMMTLEKFRCHTQETGELLTDSNKTSNDDWTLRMREVQGNIILASITQVVVGSFGLMGFILRFIGPLTIAPTISLIGLSLTHVVSSFCEGHWGISMLTLAIILFFSIFINKIKVPIPAFNLKKKCHITKLPIFQLLPVAFAVAIVWILCYTLTVADVFPSNSTEVGYKARTDSKLDIMNTAPWISFPSPFPFGIPTFSAAGYMGMLAATISSIMESVGDYFAAARLSKAPSPPAHALNRGIALEGISSIISGIVGAGHATTSYSGNIGIIGITNIASRAVFVTAGVIMVICGVIGKVGAAVALIPEPIIGGTLLLGLAMVASVGISVLQFCDMSSMRNITILGVSFLTGLMVPEWLAENPQRVNTGSKELDQVIRVLFGTASFTGGFIGFLLDNIVPGLNIYNAYFAIQKVKTAAFVQSCNSRMKWTKDERGIERWCHITENTEKEIDPNAIYEFPLITPYIKRTKICRYIPVSPAFDNLHKCVVCNNCSFKREEFELEDIEKS